MLENSTRNNNKRKIKYLIQLKKTKLDPLISFHMTNLNLDIYKLRKNTWKITPFFCIIIKLKLSKIKNMH